MTQFSRSFCLFFAVLLIAGALSPVQAQRRRPSRIEQVSALSGTITDATTGAPVAGANIAVGGLDITTDKNGNYKTATVPPGATAMEVRRWGYLTRTVPLSARTGNVLNVALQPGPIVTLTTTAGAVYPVDYELAEFQSNFPLASPAAVDPLSVCRTDGTRIEVAKQDLKLVQGPGTPVNGHACCPQGTSHRLTVTLRSGTPMEVFVADCDYYKLTFRGRDRRDGAWLILELKDIARIEFP